MPFVAQNMAPAGEDEHIDATFMPFISCGFVAMPEDGASPVPIEILRDTGAKQSLIRAGVLPFTKQTYCGSGILA